MSWTTGCQPSESEGILLFDRSSFQVFRHDAELLCASSCDRVVRSKPRCFTTKQLVVRLTATGNSRGGCHLWKGEEHQQNTKMYMEHVRQAAPRVQTHCSPVTIEEQFVAVHRHVHWYLTRLMEF